MPSVCQTDVPRWDGGMVFRKLPIQLRVQSWAKGRVRPFSLRVFPAPSIPAAPAMPPAKPLGKLLHKHSLSQTLRRLLIGLLQRRGEAVIDREQLAAMGPRPATVISLSDAAAALDLVRCSH